MEQLISTPVKGRELILGKLVPYFAIGMFDVVVAVLMGEFVFHVPLRGNVALLFGMSAIFLVGACCRWASLISIVTKSQLLSSQVAMLATFLPAFLLSGFIFPIANMPQVIQWITLPGAGAVLRGDAEGHLSEGSRAGDSRPARSLLLIVLRRR